MLLSKLFPIYIAIKGLFFPLHFDKKHNDFKNIRHEFKKERLGKLPDVINESSGLQSVEDNVLVNINDSGGKSMLFFHDRKGNLLRYKELAIKNKDWEDLTIDSNKNLFIGDFGNNANQRKDLTIYRIDSNLNHTGTIKFHFPDQKQFPPTKENLNFDCEAFFYFEDSLYLFSKNRGDKNVKLYTIPAQPGNHSAHLKDSIRLKGPITAADVNLTNNEFVLLSYGFVYFFDFQNQINFSSPKGCFYFKKSAQSEGISYLHYKEVVISNEQGNLWSFKR